jgi:exoribonuclease R
MREIVGVFVHKEAVELHGMAPRGPADQDAALRDRVLEAGNRARERQRRLTDLTNRRVIDQLFAPDLATPRKQRPLRTGTVMGVSASKIYVTLDAPRIDVKVYVGDAGKSLDTWFTLSPGKAALLDEQGRPVVRVGDPIDLRVVRRDEPRDRWVLEPVAGIRPPVATVPGAR